MQNRKNLQNRFFAIVGKDTGHRGLKFYTVSYLTSGYTFAFISFYVSCIDQKTRK